MQFRFSMAAWFMGFEWWESVLYVPEDHTMNVNSAASVGCWLKIGAAEVYAAGLEGSRGARAFVVEVLRLVLG